MMMLLEKQTSMYNLSLVEEIDAKKDQLQDLLDKILR